MSLALLCCSMGHVQLLALISATGMFFFHAHCTLQALLSVEGSDVTLTKFEASHEGVMDSFAARYSVSISCCRHCSPPSLPLFLTSSLWLPLSHPLLFYPSFPTPLLFRCRCCSPLILSSSLPHSSSTSSHSLTPFLAGIAITVTCTLSLVLPVPLCLRPRVVGQAVDAELEALWQDERAHHELTAKL
jgi:hypothetical protein